MINNQSISFPFGHGDMRLKVESNAAGDPLYIGRSRPGALTSAAEWQICKCLYDVNGILTDVIFADGVNDYIKEWDERASYTYATA
jgi:hypothetical protein